MPACGIGGQVLVGFAQSISGKPGISATEFTYTDLLSYLLKYLLEVVKGALAVLNLHQPLLFVNSGQDKHVVIAFQDESQEIDHGRGDFQAQGLD